jgi:hypothetical protein
MGHAAEGAPVGIEECMRSESAGGKGVLVAPDDILCVYETRRRQRSGAARRKHCIHPIREDALGVRELPGMRT